jgi:hypothetical protein
MHSVLKVFLPAFTGLVLLTLTGSAQRTQKPVSLFNGKDLSRWEMGSTPGFEVKGGEIHTTRQNGSNLFTKETFGNFIFNFDYLLSKVGNSGILIRCDTADPWGTGAEIQLLAPWTPYRDDLHCTASIYGHVAITHRPDETPGVWHHMEILCDRKFIRISVDGKMATEAQTDTVQSLKNMRLEGVIGIQPNHSIKEAFVKFKNLKILDLDKDPGYVLAGFSKKDPQVRKQAHDAALAFHSSIIAGDLIKMLDSEDPYLIKGSRQVLVDMVAKVTQPGAPGKEYNSLKQMIRKAKAGREVKSAGATQYLDWLLYLLGKR